MSALSKMLKLQFSLLKRRFIEPPLPKNSGGKVLVHIGCGQTDSKEFINVDARGLAHVHIITDNIASLPQFTDGSVDLIYMCHILEHIKIADLPDVLVEMKRMLKDGGILRLSVPDFDRLVEVYNASGGDINMIIKQLMGGQDHQYNIHYSVFTRRSLDTILKQAGFRDVVPWDPENCQYHDFKDRASRKITINGKAYPVSLNLEAVK
jgi:predicted SAM-dependent methyltransferase